MVMRRIKVTRMGWGQAIKNGMGKSKQDVPLIVPLSTLTQARKTVPLIVLYLCPHSPRGNPSARLRKMGHISGRVCVRV